MPLYPDARLDDAAQNSDRIAIVEWPTPWPVNR